MKQTCTGWMRCRAAFRCKSRRSWGKAGFEVFNPHNSERSTGPRLLGAICSFGIPIYVRLPASSRSKAAVCATVLGVSAPNGTDLVAHSHVWHIFGTEHGS